MLDLQNKRFVIFGLQGSGKTVLAKYICRGFTKHFIYDTMHEYQGFNRYIPKFQGTAQAQRELNTVINQVIIPNKPHIFVIDEANRYCPPKPAPLPEAVSKLNDWQRHYGIAFGCIARRPTQLHSDLTELAHYMFIFCLKGKNDQFYLNSIVSGLGDAVAGLQGHDFVMVDEHRNYQVMNAVRG